MSRSQFHSIKSLILTHAWLNLWDERMTTGRINQVTRKKRMYRESRNRLSDTLSFEYKWFKWNKFTRSIGFDFSKWIGVTWSFDYTMKFTFSHMSVCVKVHLFVWPTCLFAFLSFIVRNHKYNVNHHNETITKLRRNNTFEKDCDKKSLCYDVELILFRRRDFRRKVRCI